MAGNDQFTKLLLHCDGVNGGNVFTDVCAGASPHSVTVNGVTTVTSPAGEFGQCASFGGSGNLVIASSADFQFPGDFTVDFWINCATYSGVPYASSSSEGSTTGFLIILEPNPSLWVNSTVLGGSIACNASAWNHIALARAGSSIKLFVNGVQSGSTLSNSTNFSDGNCTLGSEVGGGVDNITGFMDEIRVSKGIARWTANFTPPAAPYDDGLYPICTTLQMPPIMAQ
jgi:hypothetical protein